MGSNGGVMQFLPNSGVPGPAVPDTFPFAEWAAAKAPIQDFTIDFLLRNELNLDIEKENLASRRQTQKCRADRANNPDVGPAIKPLYAYSEDEVSLIYHNKSADWSKLPHCLSNILSDVANHVQLQKTADAAKNNKTGVLELVRAKNEPFHSAFQEVTDTPATLRTTLASRIQVPLAWFADDRLEMLEMNDPSVKTTNHTPLSGDGVKLDKRTVLDVQHMITKGGWPSDDDTVRLTGDGVDEVGPETQLPLHHKFFGKLKNMEGCKHLWIPLEREMRLNILKGRPYNEADYLSRWNGIRGNGDSPVSTAVKRGMHTIPDSPQKTPRFGYQDAFASRGGVRLDDYGANRGRQGDRFRGGRDDRSSSATCVSCGGSHDLRDHPPTSSSFRDGTPLFSKYQVDNATRRVSFVRALNPSANICISYNIHKPCTLPSGHDGREHACSLCGGSHPALARSNDCKRVQDGRIVG